MISASEIAFFSLNEKTLSKIRKKNHPSEYRIFKLLDNPKELLATILISNNFVNISAIILFSLFVNIYFDFSGNKWLAFLCEIGVITFIIVVFGELVPKIYANQFKVGFAEFMSVPLSAMVRFFSPLNKLLVKSTSLIEKRINKKGHDLSIEEIKEVIDITGHKGVDAIDKKILKRIVNFSNVYARQIMTSRVDVVAYEYNMPFSALLADININRFSRVPVYKKNLDMIAGILYIKDLIKYFDEKNDFDWQKLIKKAYFVPENKKIDDLLREFQAKKVHLALVVDEYGGFSGLVTLEDVLEEIVGEIRDEFDDINQTLYQKIDNSTYIFDAKISLSDLIKTLNLNDGFFDLQKGEAETLGGLIIEILGKIPQKAEKISVDNLSFIIENADSKRVKQVKVCIN